MTSGRIALVLTTVPLITMNRPVHLDRQRLKYSERYVEFTHKIRFQLSNIDLRLCIIDAYTQFKKRD